jgi:hypothetical protein
MKSRVSTLWPRSIYLDFTLRVAFVATLRFGLTVAKLTLWKTNVLHVAKLDFSFASLQN